ncbi:MAG: PilZ domain-containing protein [Desulfotignum sp.]|nr:PilZ domain-containing protein [Desulfotignum sp.]MCF8138227.1 PilZ domain-containing protein [Desulfotignum sp.]
MDKLQLIKEILNTDAQTDKKIFQLIRASKVCGPDCDEVIQIDERENTRKPVSLRVNVNTGKERIMARVEDVSLSGAFINTKKKVPRGEQLAVRLISSTGEEFDFISEVVRVEKSGFGVLIKSISPFQEERFRQFVKQL